MSGPDVPRAGWFGVARWDRSIQALVLAWHAPHAFARWDWGMEDPECHCTVCGLGESAHPRLGV